MQSSQPSLVDNSPLSTPATTPYEVLLATPQTPHVDSVFLNHAEPSSHMFTMEDMLYLDGFLSECSKPMSKSLDLPQPLSIPTLDLESNTKSSVDAAHVLGAHTFQATAYQTPQTPSAPFMYGFDSNAGQGFDASFDEQMMLLSAYPSPPKSFNEQLMNYSVAAAQESLKHDAHLLSPVSPKYAKKSESKPKRAEEDEGEESTEGGKKLHPCPHPGCTRMFTRLYNVKSHMVCHSGDRPHLCNVCNASFRRKHDLQRHFRTTHSNERPWTCKKCHRSFARRDHYRRHMQVEENMEERRNSALKEMAQFQQHLQQQAPPSLLSLHIPAPEIPIYGL